MPFAGHQLTLIMGALVNQERTAMEIIEAVKKDTHGHAKIKVSSIYTQLDRLERQGLVRGKYGTEKPKSRSGRPRRYYKLLAKGHAALNQIDIVRGIPAYQGG